MTATLTDFYKRVHRSRALPPVPQELYQQKELTGCVQLTCPYCNGNAYIRPAGAKGLRVAEIVCLQGGHSLYDATPGMDRWRRLPSPDDIRAARERIDWPGLEVLEGVEGEELKTTGDVEYRDAEGHSLDIDPDDEVWAQLARRVLEEDA